MGILHSLEEVMPLPLPSPACRNVKTHPPMHWGETCTHLSMHCFSCPSTPQTPPSLFRHHFILYSKSRRDCIFVLFLFCWFVCGILLGPSRERCGAVCEWNAAYDTEAWKCDSASFMPSASEDKPSLSQEIADSQRLGSEFMINYVFYCSSTDVCEFWFIGFLLLLWFECDLISGKFNNSVTSWIAGISLRGLFLSKQKRLNAF